ncbi:hypothetical protein F2Q69_00040199 [Brassica cretica]|uniref:non-specific serine/threonine protein kinase n=1 Tax=Brassica cretica TaxID=69181 RepID=A0A8S9NGS2_BRACR|nr:hypothetical protein F2Q69_00040199 [Brassica cretica]
MLSEEELQSNVSVASSPTSNCISKGGGLKVHNYFGLSDSSSVESSTLSGNVEDDKATISLKATELTLGLPGSQSPARETELDENPFFPLLPTKDEIFSSSQKNIASGNKRGFSDTMYTEKNWMFPEAVATQSVVNKEVTQNIPKGQLGTLNNNSSCPPAAKLSDPDGKLNDWVITGDNRNPCNWTGITCDSKNSAFTAIDLSDYGVSGGFPYGFCRIRTLVNITLSKNNLNGTIDSSPLSLCSRIHVLILTENSFSGNLPEFSPEFRNLRVLELESNFFSGEIPESYGKLTSLQVLNLNGNSLAGIAPAFLGNLTELTRLELAYVQFEPGPIPSAFGSLAKLSILRLTNSNFVGEIPDSIGNLVSLVNLDLAKNGLSGEIPESIGKLKSIYQLVLFVNNLSGKLPESIGNLTAMRNFDVSQNSLSGELPETIAALQLVSFHLNDNFFTGELPRGIALNPNLVDFKIFNNSFTGSLPRSFGKFSDLTEFDVSTNNFSGELPPYLCYGKKLEKLISFSNQLSGEIPETYGECDSLNYIRMADNKLSGQVPVRFWELPLTRLELSNNRLQGSIPPSISKARQLSQLEISGNKFSGAIPVRICDLGGLRVVDLSRNRFSGSIPSCINRLKNLERLEMQENMLDGEIPSSVRSCPKLTELNLSDNRLRGGIPPELGDLPVLNYLDLSNNQLTGEVPAELLKLKLNQFNVSDNKLSGKIPSGFQQDIFLPSFLGNPDLCAPDMDPIRPCRSKPEPRFILVISVVCIVALIGALVWLFIKTKPLFQRKPNRTDKVTIFQRIGFTEEDIYPQLTEDNIIGSGGSGLVYRVTLKSGQTLAVKKLWGGPGHKPESESVFRSEVEILGRVRHGNIVKLLMCCSGEEFRFLVYEYMENGSLGDVLHSEKEHRAVSPLDWTTRFSIALGIQDRSSIGSHDPSRPKMFIFICTSNCSRKGYLGRPLNIESTFRVSTGCAHRFGFFFFAGPSVAVIAILLIHITDVKTIVLLAKKLNSISRSGGGHGGRGGGRGGGGHEDHVGMEKKKNARDRKDVECWSGAQTPVSKSRVAMDIAGSAKREHRFQSCIASCSVGQAILEYFPTGCAHGFGFFFFAGPSVTVIAILLIHITDVKLACVIQVSWNLGDIRSWSCAQIPVSKNRVAMEIAGYLGRPLNIETTFRVSTGCAHGFGFFFLAGPSVAVIAILLIHITDVKTIVLLAKKLNSISRSMSAWRRRRMRGIEKMWNGSSTSDMETMDLGLF